MKVKFFEIEDDSILEMNDIKNVPTQQLEWLFNNLACCLHARKHSIEKTLIYPVVDKDGTTYEAFKVRED